MEKINVTKSFLPPLEEYGHYLEQIWSNVYLSNQGPLLKEFEKQSEQYLGVDNFHFVTNGTLALQVALRALNITEGEIITTPFSFVATTSSIVWERCKPVFVDIKPDTLCIDADKIEAAITSKTKAILAVHVFGYPCEVDKIETIARKHNLKVIYDGAHAFGVEYKGRSLLSYGDITTCSFHATKLFHTIEGGAIVVKDKEVSRKVDLIKKFGNVGDEYLEVGINAKASEFQAAMGLCNFKYIDEIIQKRGEVYNLYTALLNDEVRVPAMPAGVTYNYSYYPVIFKNEEHLLRVFKKLNEADIYPRRYFYPSLNKLSYLNAPEECPISEDVASKIACLPLYVGLEEAVIQKIAEIINEA